MKQKRDEHNRNKKTAKRNRLPNKPYVAISRQDFKITVIIFNGKKD